MRSITRWQLQQYRDHSYEHPSEDGGVYVGAGNGNSIAAIIKPSID